MSVARTCPKCGAPEGPRCLTPTGKLRPTHSAAPWFKPKPKFTGAFFIVWNPLGERPPVATFSTEAQAQLVADKMTTRHPGCSFFVMRAVAVGLYREEP